MCRNIEQYIRGATSSERTILWKILKRMIKNTKEKAQLKCINTQQWGNYYKGLLTESHNLEEMRKIKHMEIRDSTDQILTLNEVQVNIKFIKNGISADAGGIVPELIEYEFKIYDA